MNRKLAVGAGAIALVAIVYFASGGGSGSKPDTDPATAAQPAGTSPKIDLKRAGTIEVSSRGGDVMIDDDPKGALQLEGQVIDAEDKPVKGATIMLSANPPRVVTSEDDGSFAFPALVGRPYTLVARAPSGVAGPVTAQLTAKSDPIILKLRPGAKLTVTVTAGGKPTDANVELRGGGGELSTVAAGGTAVFDPVPPGGYQLVAWADGTARTHQWIQIASGNQEAKLSLSPGSPVTGRVIDDKGNPVAGARVRYSGASDWSQQGSDRLDAAMTAGDGTFKLEAMPAGTFRFIATHGDHAPGSSALVTLDGKTLRDGVTITLEGGAVVRGKVVDERKQPVVAARIRIGVAANPRVMTFEQPRTAYSDAAGAFEIRGLPRKPLAAVALHTTGASSTEAIDASAGDVSGVTLEIDVTGAIAGIVVDPNGQPMEGVQVTAGPNFADNRTRMDFGNWRLRGFPQELTDAGGKFTLTGLAPGDYRLSAASSTARSRRGPGVGDGVVAKTGDTNVKITLPPEGGIKGKVAFADGNAPSTFTVSVGMVGQPQSGSDGEFVLDGLPPQRYELSVRGPTFQARTLEVLVESGKLTDAGTITVVKGRQIGGTVVAEGRPVPGAQVHVGRIVFGNGTSGNAQFGPMGAGTKHDTTDENGRFLLSGFNAGDMTIVAEHDTIGRSRAQRLPTLHEGQTELTLVLEKYGSLSGVMRQGGKPVEGVLVSCQSITTPGAIFGVASGPDGTYRYDRLAPDTYKVSATVGMPMTGMKFYAKQIVVPSGKHVTIDLAVEPGNVTVDVTVTASNGKVGVANVYLAQGKVTAPTANELGVAMAALGPGATQWVIMRNGEPARFSEVQAGAYSVCVTPFPAEVRGMAAMGYAERHGDTLPAFCKPLAVNAAPETQVTTVTVELPPFISDEPPAPGPGSGSGSGS